MELSAQAGPGVEKAAEEAVESACHLADLVNPDGWSTVTSEDVLDAIDPLTKAFGRAEAELAQALVAVARPHHRAAATIAVRRRLGIAVDGQAPGRDNAASAPVARGPGRRPPRASWARSGLGGIRTER
ncbi:hypothetical protein GCM10010255_62380 [Streptomyces coeruleofuscus]|uniref:Uncharacterized protein n=1 Tax=Streptomyces coeruleofuscus TaxID=66879 RepID=A0ABN3IXJ6_9ACTN